MASYHYYFSLVAFSFFILIQTTSSLRCYVCTTKQNGNTCSDPFNKNQTLETCDIPTSVCLKQILPPLGKLPESLHRACVDENYCKAYEKQSTHCSICKIDGCNTSVTILPSFSIIIPMFGVYYYVYINFNR